MDRMKPIDLERIELKTRFRGYDRSQVDLLLKQAADEMTALLAQIQDKDAEIGKLRSSVETYQAQEGTLKEALMLAQRAADETRANAHKEAELIVQEARQRVEEIGKDSKASLADLRWDMERLRLDKQRFINGFRTLLEGHLRELAEANRGLAVVEGDAKAEPTDIAQA